jgi:hypothetical protein
MADEWITLALTEGFATDPRAEVLTGSFLPPGSTIKRVILQYGVISQDISSADFNGIDQMCLNAIGLWYDPNGVGIPDGGLDNERVDWMLYELVPWSIESYWSSNENFAHHRFYSGRTGIEVQTKGQRFNGNPDADANLWLLWGPASTIGFAFMALPTAYQFVVKILIANG